MVKENLFLSLDQVLDGQFDHTVKETLYSSSEPKAVKVHFPFSVVAGIKEVK